jgi:signal transduction histidine kinase
MNRGPRRDILIVDDNESLGENLREILEGAGYLVRIAPSAAEARRQAAAGFQVGLVDVRLPDGDGTNLARELKELCPDSEVILLTGFATLESAMQAVRAGAWAYLIKPCATEDLLLSVEQAMKQVHVLEDRRELERRAAVAEKLAAVGTMTAGLSHEIRNPLNAAALQLAVLERRLQKLPEELRGPLLEPLDIVETEIQRLNSILEDFLQFARPRELHIRPTPLTEVIERVCTLLKEQLERAGLRCEIDVKGPVMVQGDPVKLQQVLLNLALNAIEATPAGGVLRLRALAQGCHAFLSVEDDGPGIPPEVRARIFEPFFTTKASGSGLGLPLVHSIIDQHGGSIRVEDVEPHGTRFVITLHAAEAKALP